MASSSNLWQPYRVLEITAASGLKLYVFAKLRTGYATDNQKTNFMGSIMSDSTFAALKKIHWVIISTQSQFEIVALMFQSSSKPNKDSKLLFF